MKVEKRNSSPERRILTGMIIDKNVLGRISSKWTKEGLFKSKWCNLVGSWCVSYFNKHGKAPRRHIEHLFESWATGAKDEDSVKMVESFLDSLSKEYQNKQKDLQSDYLIEYAGNYFVQVQVEKFHDALQGDLDSHKMDQALKRISSFNKLEMGTGAYVDVLRDKEAIRQAFESKGEPLITFPGALGHFFSDAFERDSFVAFMGPEGVGKSFLLQEIAWTGIRQRRKVAFFEVGDQSQHQIMRRFMVRAARHPMKTKRLKFPLDVLYPAEINREPEMKIAEVTYKKKTFDSPISWQRAYKACREVIERTKTKETLLRLQCHPNSTVNVAKIRETLADWERNEWVPDMVVIDYADILAPPAGVAETRDQINATWKQLRALSQSLHCCVVTATQSDADSYKRDTMSRMNFSEDKRKYGHVTSIFGINQTPAEKEKGIIRLNSFKFRDEEFIETRVVHVAGSLKLACPFICSCD